MYTASSTASALVREPQPTSVPDAPTGPAPGLARNTAGSRFPPPGLTRVKPRPEGGGERGWVCQKAGSTGGQSACRLTRHGRQLAPFPQSAPRTWRLLRPPHSEADPGAAAARDRDRGERERRGLRGQVVAGQQADVADELTLGRHREARPVDADAAAGVGQVARDEVHLPAAVGAVAARQRGLRGSGEGRDRWWWGLGRCADAALEGKCKWAAWVAAGRRARRAALGTPARPQRSPHRSHPPRPSPAPSRPPAAAPPARMSRPSHRGRQLPRTARACRTRSSRREAPTC
jgi:hypothetical protein